MVATLPFFLVVKLGICGLILSRRRRYGGGIKGSTGLTSGIDNRSHIFWCHLETCVTCVPQRKVVCEQLKAQTLSWNG